MPHVPPKCEVSESNNDKNIGDGETVIKSIIPLVEESIGDEEVSDDNTKVQKLAEDESSQVHRVPTKQDED